MASRVTGALSDSYSPQCSHCHNCTELYHQLYISQHRRLSFRPFAFRAHSNGSYARGSLEKHLKLKQMLCTNAISTALDHLFCLLIFSTISLSTFLAQEEKMLFSHLPGPEVKLISHITILNSLAFG